MKILIKLLVASAVLMSCQANTGDTASSTSNATKVVESEKTLVRIDSLEGSGTKQSKAFHLSGGPVTIVYSYKSAVEGVGVFYAYVLDKGTDVNKDGALPDVSVSSGSEKSSSEITRNEGDYYLMVNAHGNYKAVIMEWK